MVKIKDSCDQHNSNNRALNHWITSLLLDFCHFVKEVKIFNKYLQCNPNMDGLLFHEDLQKPSKPIETSKKSFYRKHFAW